MRKNDIESKPISGPYRATKLWNDAVRSFYNGMTLSRHWRGLRQYEHCFTASEAINWLHNYLASNPNFGPSVTRDQTTKLLRKFVKCGLIVEARGNKIYAEDFHDNRDLFRFASQSPLKALRTPVRPPLAPIILNALSNNGSSPFLRNSNCQKPDLKLDGKKENSINEKKEENFSAVEKSQGEEEVNLAWQETFSEKLEWVCEKLMVGGDGSSSLLPTSSINATWIRHNMNLLKSKGIIRTEGFSSDQLPDWIMSAMRSLVYWPNSSDSICNIPNYPGVEVDIFKVVREFFSSMVIPLIPYELYDPIIRLYIGAEFLDIAHRTPSSRKHSITANNESNKLDHSFSTLSTCDSVEDLILNISVGGAHHISTPCHNNVNNYKECPSQEHNTKFVNDDKEYINKTPTGNRVKKSISTLPRSLKLNKLTNYTDFKDSYLYPHDEDSLQPFKSTVSNLLEKNSLNSTGRVTLKSLKHKANLASKNTQLKNEMDDSVTATFQTILKTEELDNFSLPPNSCFETAFTSDSPRTRIIPQKSVDTIHFRNLSSSSRPKSIAVSSLKGLSSLNSYHDKCKLKLSAIELNKKKEDSPMNESNNSILNRSASEGNLLKTRKGSSSDQNWPCTSLLRRKELNFRNCSMKKSFCSKSSLAAKVRDSIKRRKEKVKASCDFGSNTSRDYCEGNSLEMTPMLPNGSFEAIKRLRTKSGGYTNPAYSVHSSSTPDTLSIKSSVSDLNNFKNTSRGYLNFDLAQIKMESKSIETRWTQSSDEASSYSDVASTYKSNSPPPSSPVPSDVSSSDVRRNPCYAYRSKSVTPDGCLSHSLASCLSNSIYHSALSGFNQTSISSTPLLMKTATEFPEHINQMASPPDLPKRQPALQMNTSNFDSFRQTEDGIGRSICNSVDIRTLSSSASELSDNWTDRTPFGTVPPYFRGGLWRHYHSSPSKRLMGRENRFIKASGNGICLPGLLTRIGKEVCIEALQLVFLIIEPKRRRRLYLLLKMMSRVSSNEKLQLDSSLTNRALMVKTFSRSVMLSAKERDYDEMLATRIVTFLMDNYTTIFSPPQNLAVLVHRKMNTNAERVKTLPQDSHGREYSSESTRHPITYCLQVSPETYEKQKFTSSQQFLLELLDQIVDNPKLSDKEKRKKLKEFRTHYPEIYENKFPPGKENELRGGGEKKGRLKGFKKFASIRSLARSKSIRI